MLVICWQGLLCVFRSHVFTFYVIYITIFVCVLTFIYLRLFTFVHICLHAFKTCLFARPGHRWFCNATSVRDEELTAEDDALDKKKANESGQGMVVGKKPIRTLTQPSSLAVASSVKTNLPVQKKAYAVDAFTNMYATRQKNKMMAYNQKKHRSTY